MPVTTCKMKRREIIESEPRDYEEMQLCEFIDLIKNEMCPQDVLVFASKAPKVIKAAQRKAGCQNCPLIQYVIKSSNLCAELVMWLEAEWNQDKIFNS